MHRILAKSAETRERRDQLRHPSYARPELLATRPNELWSWDITKLLGPSKWTYFYLYVILDVFSRYIVGWMVAHRESARLAEKLIAETCERQAIKPGQLTIHADRGSSMTSKQVTLLLSDLSITKTHSRPHVSDDNPFSEAHFKTMKYRPDFPDRFGEVEPARSFFVDFFDWYNNEHHHAGLAMLTPADVHFGRVDQRIVERQAVLDAAFALRSERFPRGRPIAVRPPREVWINKPSAPPELGAPVGDTLCPSPALARSHRAQRRATERPESPAVARRGELASLEHGEDGEDATLPAASTMALSNRDGQRPNLDNPTTH